MVAQSFLRDRRIALLVQTWLSVVKHHVDYQHCCETAKVGLKIEMNWYHSLVQSVGQCVVTLLSML